MVDLIGSFDLGGFKVNVGLNGYGLWLRYAGSSWSWAFLDNFVGDVEDPADLEVVKREVAFIYRAHCALSALSGEDSETLDLPHQLW